MKKFFMVAVMAVAAYTANAQVWIGGEFNLSSKSSSSNAVGYVEKDATTNFGIAPEIGYNFNDNWAVALDLGYQHVKENVKSTEYGSMTGRSNTFSIAPFARYKFYKKGNFAAFVDGGVNFSTTHFNNSDEKMDNWKEFGVGVRPGISYNVTDKIALVAKLGGLGYNYGWTNVNEYLGVPCDIKYSESEFQFNLVREFSFGINFDL